MCRAIGRVMSVVRLTERVAAPFEGAKVTGTPEAPVIEGVLLCGPTSANKRRYLREAFAGERVKRYNGAPVKITAKHGDVNGLYQEEIGTVQNARHRDDGMPVGDIAVNPKKPFAEAFVWDATHQPKACGMSHVANCETKQAKDGWDEVTELVEALSVDVIGARRAATTKGLFEGKGVALTIKELAEALVKHPKISAKRALPLKALAEDDMMGAAPTAMDAPPADDADPADGVKEAFKTAVMHIVDQAMEGELDPKEALSKIKKLLASHDEVNGDSGDDTSGKDGEDTDGMDGTPESKKKPDPWGLLKECREVCGPEFVPSDTLLESLALQPDSAKRKTLLAEWKAQSAAPVQQPQSGRPKPPPTTKETKVPTDAKAFAESIR